MRHRRRDAGRVGRRGVAEVPEDAAVVLVHDAARPLLPDEVIERVLAPLAEGWDGAVPALPVPDTVKRVDGDAVVETLPRDELVAVQTPQAFVAPTCCGARSPGRRGRDATARRSSRRRRPGAGSSRATRGC